jgi:hypothetical protein
MADAARVALTGVRAAIVSLLYAFPVVPWEGSTPPGMKGCGTDSLGTDDRNGAKGCKKRIAYRFFRRRRTAPQIPMPARGMTAGRSALVGTGVGSVGFTNPLVNG